jgi:hypothetical protein
VAALAGHPGAAVAGGAAALAMAVWLLIYRSVSAPINRQLTAAAHDGRAFADGVLGAAASGPVLSMIIVRSAQSGSALACVPVLRA